MRKSTEPLVSSNIYQMPCPECGTIHRPDEPHNPENLAYQRKFYAEHGRFPTWDDAMAHCSEDTQARYRKEIRRQQAGFRKSMQDTAAIEGTFTIQARRCQRCGGLLTSTQAIRDGYGHTCKIKVRGERLRELKGQMTITDFIKED